MGRKSKPATPVSRDGIWYLVRRVPAAWAHLDRRGLVRISTDIRVADDPKGISAGRAVEALDRGLHDYWRSLEGGAAEDARARFDAVRDRARQMGLLYRPAADLAAGDLDELLARIERIAGQPAAPAVDVAAVLGGEPRPAISLSGLFDEYEALKGSALRNKSPDQRRRWGNAKKRALANFVALTGDKPVAEVTRGDVLAFRAWWQQRLDDEGLQVDTANKDFSHLQAMFREVDRIHQMNLDPVFAQMKLDGSEERRRVAYAPAFIQDAILAPGALGDLNDEAAAIVWLMADSGVRLSEACNLEPEHIRLDDDIPHIRIRPTARRQLKTRPSARDIPLVGVALDAMRRFPNGFPRYHDKAATASATINKVLDAHKLRPEPGQSLYSLRHSFDDRLTEIDTPDKVVAALMGHRYKRENYGLGPTLKQKLRWLERIAFRVPARPAGG